MNDLRTLSYQHFDSSLYDIYVSIFYENIMIQPRKKIKGDV